jgi:hypothetical protein
MFRLALGVVSLASAIVLFVRWMRHQAQGHGEAGHER